MILCINQYFTHPKYLIFRLSNGPSVGADGEQPISETSVSIPDAAGNYNPAELDTENYFREMDRMTDPAYLPTITMQGLYEKVYDSRPAIIKGLLHTGT